MFMGEGGPGQTDETDISLSFIKKNNRLTEIKINVGNDSPNWGKIPLAPLMQIQGADMLKTVGTYPLLICR